MWRTALAVLTVAAFAGCDGNSDPRFRDIVDERPAEIVVFHFEMLGDATGLMDFRAATGDPSVIDAARDQLALPEHERRVHINGPIRRGNGGHNLEWNWHFVVGEWSLVEASIELCDGNGVLIEQAIDYWVDQVGTFCPWLSYVADEVGVLSELTDQIIVKYVTDMSGPALQQAIHRARSIAARFGIELSYFRARALGTHVFRMDRSYPVATIEDFAAALEADDPTVVYAEPDRIVHSG
jgi:hypothetical protein